jgi:hypothetical protein
VTTRPRLPAQALVTTRYRAGDENRHRLTCHRFTRHFF